MGLENSGKSEKILKTLGNGGKIRENSGKHWKTLGTSGKLWKTLEYSINDLGKFWGEKIEKKLWKIIGCLGKLIREPQKIQEDFVKNWKNWSFSDCFSQVFQCLPLFSKAFLNFPEFLSECFSNCKFYTDYCIVSQIASWIKLFLFVLSRLYFNKCYLPVTVFTDFPKSQCWRALGRKWIE